jgi:phosphatidylserine decarboxylase
MAVPWRVRVSNAVGWLADREVPRPLRAPLYRAYSRLTGADVAECRPPLEAYPSLSAFFVRRLVDGARTWPEDLELLPSPADGRLQAEGRVDAGRILQAKGQSYSLAELVGPVAKPGELDGAHAWTIYLSPRDYHRVHCPEAGVLERAAWLGGERYSVAPRVLLGREGVFVRNERVALRLVSPTRGPYFVVLVGALNVGRLRVVGLEHRAESSSRKSPHFARGEELGRFEMGSTVVLVFPAGPHQPAPLEGVAEGAVLRLGQPLARYAKTRPAGSD